MKNFQKIEDHGVIFNNRTAALVASNGEIDWACFPNFDSDPVFFSLLDSKRGGYFKTYPENLKNGYQYYEGDTNILYTFFYNNNEKVLKIMDFMPTTKYPTMYFSEIHRYVQAYRSVNLLLEFSPFDRSKRRKIIERKDTGYLVKQNGKSMLISAHIKMVEEKNILKGKYTMKMGEGFWIVISYGLDKIYSLKNFRSDDRLVEARNYWKNWLSKSKYGGKYYDIVNRSLLTLKGLFFEPNSFMVAAPTTSLPESIRGERNWDYRYTWIRDTAYVIDIFSKLGYLDEATIFLNRIIDRIEREGELSSIYTISGKKDISERIVDWEGYEKSRPVRFGNDAFSQFQLDQYGSLIHGIYELVMNGGTINMHIWEKMRKITDMIIENWKKPDNSIWEFRTEPKHYVYSKVLAWRAIKDMIELQNYYNIDDDDYFILLNDTLKSIYDSIIKNGISKDNYFTQYYGSEYIDAAHLRLPLIGFCSADDLTFQNTFKQIEKRLMVEDFLFKRYDSEDGLKSEDNAFLILSFWYIEDLLKMGDFDRAREGLIKIMNMFNNLYLLPEEIEFKTHRYLGNYPQALSHLGLISAIISVENKIFNFK